MNERTAVVLSETGLDPRMAKDLANHDVRVDCYRRVEDLFGERDPGGIPVLIFHLRERPKGRVLEVIGRMSIEHPRVQMVALSETPLTLEIAEFLAGRGVVVMEAAPGVVEAGDLTEAVTRMHERRDLSLAIC
jgi:hypothetical protein